MKRLLILIILLASTKWVQAANVSMLGTIALNGSISIGPMISSGGGGGGTSFVFVASTISNSTNGNNTTTSAINTTGANLLLIGFTFFTGGSAPVLTDNKSNTWTQLAISSVTGNLGSVIYYSSNPIVGAGHTFTESASNTFPTVCVLALSGDAAVSPFDQQNGNNSNGLGSTIQTNSVSPTVDNEVLFTVVAADTAGTDTINSGFTISNQAAANGNSYNTGCAYIIKGAGTAGVGVNPTWTNPGSNTEATRIATFK